MQLRITYLLLLLSGLARAQSDTANFELPPAEIFEDLEEFEAHKEQQFDSLTYTDPLLFDLDDLLSSRTPVFIKQYGNSGIATAGFRGTGAVHTSVLWNGLDVNSPTLGQSDLNVFPLALAGQVDVTYGISSLPGNSAGLGGTISMKDELDFDNRFEARTRLGYGSFQKAEGLGKISWGSEKWQFESGIFHREAENNFHFVDPSRADNPVDTLQNADYSISGFTQSVGFRPNAKNTFAMHLNGTQSDRTIPGILLSPGNYSRQWDKNIRGVLEWKHLRKKSIHRFQSGATHDILDYHGDEESLTNTSSLQSQYRGFFMLTEKWNLRTLLQHRTYFAESYGYEDQKSQNRSIASATVERESPKNRLFLTIREEKIDEVYSPFLFSIGAAQKLIGGISLKANAGRNYRYPTFNDLYWNPGGNPNLKPEIGWSGEVGVEWKRSTENDLVKLDHIMEINFYHSVIDNWILWSPDGGLWRPQNLWKVQNEGVEVTISESAEMRDVTLRGDLLYSYTSTENVSENNNESKQLIYVPFHTARATLSAEWKRWTAKAQYAFNGERYISSDHSSWMPYFMTTDISLGRAFGLGENRLQVSFTVNNLLDKDYEVMPWRPMPGRNFMANVICHFNGEKKSGK